MARTARRKAKRHRKEGIVAWLITWEHSGEHAAPPKRVVAALNYRLSGKEVREFVERFYVAQTCNPDELIAYAKDRKTTAYAAEFDRVDGIAWEGRISCGDNPWLEARLVNDLRAERSPFGDIEVKWSERSRPVVNGIVTR